MPELMKHLVLSVLCCVALASYSLHAQDPRTPPARPPRQGPPRAEPVVGSAPFLDDFDGYTNRQWPSIDLFLTTTNVAGYTYHQYSGPGTTLGEIADGKGGWYPSSSVDNIGLMGIALKADQFMVFQPKQNKNWNTVSFMYQRTIRVFHAFIVTRLGRRLEFIGPVWPMSDSNGFVGDGHLELSSPDPNDVIDHLEIAPLGQGHRALVDNVLFSFQSQESVGR